LLSARSDVVYATSMVGRSALATRAPLVVKVAGDPAYERAKRRGLFDGVLDGFQDADVGAFAAALRRWRTFTVGRAACLVCPSSFLRDIVVSWGVPPERVTVLPNATPPLPHLRSRADARASLGAEGAVLAFAGRLTPAKSLEVLFAAVDAVEGVTLLVAGDGELRTELQTLAGPRVRLLGALPRERVLELFAAADAATLSSSWENFPHALVEALAVGTPVIATAVGGVPEIVVDGENGLLVPPGDPEAFAAAIRRFLSDAALRERLHAGAAPSVEKFAPERVLERLERILASTVGA
jgi:glycosyltransferase involved in cell wall biosynthesis